MFIDNNYIFTVYFSNVRVNIHTNNYAKNKSFNFLYRVLHMGKMYKMFWELTTYNNQICDSYLNIEGLTKSAPKIIFIILKIKSIKHQTTRQHKNLFSEL